MKCKSKTVCGAKAVAVLSALVLCGLCVCFVSCNEDADEKGLSYDTYNADGTLGSSGLSQSDWESLLSSISNEGTIVLSSELTSDDLAVFATALIASGKTGVTLDLSNLSITSIAAGTFAGCTGITSVVLPESVVSIGESAFSGCTSLTSITIGSSLVAVGENAFSGCSALALVTYGGTVADWEEIETASGNEYLTGATVVCSDGSITGGTSTYTGTSETYTASYSGEDTDALSDYSFTVTYTTDSEGNTTISKVVASDSDGEETQLGGTDGVYTLSVTDEDGYEEVYTISFVVSDGSVSYTYTVATVEDAEASGGLSGTYGVHVKYTSSSGGYTVVAVEVDDGENLVSLSANSGGTYTYTVDSDGLYTSDTDSIATEYTITLDETSAPSYSYTYTSVGMTNLIASTTQTSIGTVVVKCSSESGIAAVTVNGTQATASSDGTFTYSDGDYIYTITVSESGGSYSYSYEVIEADFFGSSDSDFADFVWRLSSLSDGCTIVLSPELTSEQLKYFVTALKKTSLSGVTVDMSYMTITEIDEKLFYECTNITFAFLPSCLETIGSYAFAYCSSLMVATIPDSVTSLGSYAFRGCTALQAAVIGDGVTTIPTYAFYECTSLASVTIGSGVTTIASYAFGYCSELETVYYNGTKSEWESISISSTSSEEHNYYLRLATIICTDGVYKY